MNKALKYRNHAQMLLADLITMERLAEENGVLVNGRAAPRLRQEMSSAAAMADMMDDVVQSSARP